MIRPGRRGSVLGRKVGAAAGDPAGARRGRPGRRTPRQTNRYFAVSRKPGAGPYSCIEPPAPSSTDRGRTPLRLPSMTWPEVASFDRSRNPP
jgi:hypothetical protein